MNIINNSAIEKIAAWVAVIEFLFVVIKHVPSFVKNAQSFLASNKLTNPAQRFIKLLQNITTRPAVWGTVLFFILGWFFYSLPWALFAFAFRWNFLNIFKMVFSWTFLGLSASVFLCERITKLPNVRRFIGGCLSLGGLAIYYTSINENMLKQAPGITWFVVFGVFGGILGIAVGSLVAYTMSLLKIRTPL